MGIARNHLFSFASTCTAARAYESLWQEVCERLAEDSGRPPLYGKRRRKDLERLAEERHPSKMLEDP